MIRYALGCAAGHDFESWFPSSGAYDEQAGRGLVTCPVCDSAEITKRIMAPSVARTDKGAAGLPLAPGPGQPAEPVATEPPATDAAQPLALLSDAERHMRALLKAVREHVTRTAEHVGPRFADEARRIHTGEVEHRSIYGEASAADARALLEEGIEIHPLPVLPEDRN